MNGTNNEPFFQESKRHKRERFKWIILLMSTNLITFMLTLAPPQVQQKAAQPWPVDWVEVSLDAHVMASGSLPQVVTITNQQGQVILKKAYLISQKNHCSSFSQTQSAQFRLSPSDLSKLNRQNELRVLPYSDQLAQTQPMPKKRKTYEINF